MCGIVGILNRDADQHVNQCLVEDMTDLIAHRGPDRHGIHIDRNVGLGHRRLSILDLEAGQQPMTDPDSGRVIIYNGEIYNYLELESQLSRQGMHFATTCDTELVLKSFDGTKPEVLESFNGMFAFALWDPSRRCLTLVRDRLGIKPLYYADTGKNFVFGSEIKSLLLHPAIKAEPDADRVYEFLAYRTLAGTGTMFRNIKQIPPGHIARLRAPDYRLELAPYWTEGEGRDLSSYVDTRKDFVEQFDEIFEDAVKARLISDVPVGTFNSGGVDSSLVSSIVRKLKKDDLHTFSAGFEEQSHDERKYAQIVANKLGTTHHTIVLSNREYCDELERTLWHLEEPINHAHSVQILHLSKVAKQYVTVVLTGEGADELFAGYPRFNVTRLAGAIPGPIRNPLSKLVRPIAESLRLRRVVKLAEAMSASKDELISDNARYVALSDLERLGAAKASFPERAAIYDRASQQFDQHLQAMLYFDQRTYLPSLLTRLDKMSMGASIEARVPFLDYRLVEWSYKTPTSIKLRYLQNKWVVKKAAENWLPPQIVHRSKVGFGAPLAKWLRDGHGLGRYLDLLGDQRARDRGYFDQDVVTSLINDHRNEKGDHSEILWGLLNLELWHRKFIDA